MTRGAFAAGLVVLAVVASGCPWGATGSGASGDEKLDDSAEAMVGTYTVASVATASDSCEQLETTEPEDPGSVRIARMEKEGDESETKLRIVVCSGGDPCASESVDAGGDGATEASADGGTERRRQRVRTGAGVRMDELTKAPDAQGWTLESGWATAVDGAASARSCRLEWTSVKLVPEKDGVRIERTVHRKSVTLEGNMQCNGEMAETQGEALPCVDRSIWRAAESRADRKG